VAHIPVVVGVGQVANKDPERIVHPVELIVAAARGALADAGADLRDRIGAVYSAPLSVFSEARGADLVAEQLGIGRGERHQSTYSGAGPQHHLANAAHEIAAGRLDAALIVGGIADASVRAARRRGIEPPSPPTSVWSQGSDGVGASLTRVLSAWRHPYCAEAAAGAQMPSSYFAVLASALAAAAAHDAGEHRTWYGELLAPFTAVAATRPDLAWFPEPRAPADISTPTDDNRFVAEPFTKLMCSFPTIDLAAAVIVTSVDVADRLGIPDSARVYPWAAASAKEHGPPSERAAMHRSEAYALAARTACQSAGVAPSDIGAFDLYSCFPAAVELGMAAFDVAPGDRRPLTLTGGLPYFGGPGASYALHGIACAVERCRTTDDVVAVGALGGFVDDFGVGLYSRAVPQRPFAHAGSLRPPASGVLIARRGDEVAEVIAGTVLHDRDAGPVEAPVIVRLANGARLGAKAASAAIAAEVAGTTLVGRRVRIRPDGDDANVWLPTE
jgi:acetyl-CoA C-acetyltransferase